MASKLPESFVDASQFPAQRPALKDQMCVWDNLPGYGRVFPAEEDRARQEFKEEADLEFQIRRFGAGVPFQSGSVDYTLDLTKAFDLVERAQAAWSELPRVIRERYQNWPAVERAAAAGELEPLLKAAADPGAPAAPAAGATGSAPASAPPGATGVSA